MHTPGPWYVVKQAEYIVRGNKEEVARASPIYMDRQQRLANARLISVAPEMLDLLLEAHTLAKGDFKDRLKIVLVKAMGE